MHQPIAPETEEHDLMTVVVVDPEEPGVPVGIGVGAKLKPDPKGGVVGQGRPEGIPGHEDGIREWRFPGPGAENVAGQTGIAGSTRVGDRVVVGGAVGIGDHLSVGDDARIAGRSGVTKDVPAGEAWGGYPAQPMKRWARERYLIGRLEELWAALRSRRAADEA